MAAKKALEEARSKNEELRHKDEFLTIELDMANSNLRSLQKQEDKFTAERTTSCREKQLVGARSELASTLHFQMADEMGEIMDSSSALPPKMFSDIHDDNHRQYHTSITKAAPTAASSQE